MADRIVRSLNLFMLQSCTFVSPESDEIMVQARQLAMLSDTVDTSVDITRRMHSALGRNGSTMDECRCPENRHLADPDIILVAA
eukprot:1595111-Pyramimonas_sp.AAC.1